MELNLRQINQYIWDEELAADKMIFISGPRQIGKTTYVKGFLKKNKSGVYLNWDNPEVREIDFLITLNNSPVVFIETKLSDTTVSKPYRNLKEQLRIPFIQVVKKPGIWKREGSDVLVLSAEKLLAVLP